MTTYKLNRFQIAAAGLKLALAPNQAVWPSYEAFRKDWLDTVGDTLFQFFMLEGCLTAAEAGQRIEQALSDMSAVLDAVLDVEDDEPEIPDDTPSLDTFFHDHEMDI